MIRIKSYLRTDNTFHLLDAVSPKSLDGNYIEGAIELSINDVPIIDQRMWDYVDQLWAYIADMVFRLESDPKLNDAHTFFPDQPIKLEFRRIGDNLVLVSADVGAERHQSTIQESTLLDELRRSGINFFENMAGLVPQNAEAYFEAIEQLRFRRADGGRPR